MDIVPDLHASIPQLAAQFRQMAAAAKMIVVGDDLLGLAAYPRKWDRRVMLCAHADTIACAPGYDDRAGVAVMFNIMAADPRRFAYSLFMDEERGASGSRTIKLTEVPHIFVGLDRRGVDNVAFYDEESRHDWSPWVLRNGGRPVHGSFTDCTNLSRRFDRCCLNLSVGFMSEHTPGETFDPAGAEFARSLAYKV